MISSHAIPPFKDAVLPVSVLSCRNPNRSSHKNDIEDFYDSIISIFNQNSVDNIPSNSISYGFHAVLGWNEYVEEHHKHARDA